MSELLAPTVNLVILVSILVYYLRAPMRQFVSQRHEGIRDELARVRELLRDATTKHEEFSSKLKAIDAETSAIKQQLMQDAQAAKQRLLADGQRLSANIASDARRMSDALYTDLRGELYADLSSRVLEKAEKLLRERLTGDDRARIQKEFSAQVGQTGASS